MYPLFLEFLGTTELLVILVAALVLFGPRKLPELSRSLGKSLAQFKSASEDFKRTWEQEVSVAQSKHEAQIERAMLPEDDSLIKAGEDRAAAVLAATEPAEQTYARSSSTANAPAPSAAELSNQTPTETSVAPIAAVTDSTATQIVFDASSDATAGNAAASPAPPSKRDWL